MGRRGTDLALDQSGDVGLSLAELRDKAAMFEEAGLVDVYDSASRTSKLDVILSPELLEDLESGVEKLAQEHQARSSTPKATVTLSVDPNLFPLIYRKSRIRANGGQVGLLDAIEHTGRGSIIPKQAWERHTLQRAHRNRRGFGRDWQHSWEARAHRYSPSFQWCRARLHFLKDRGPRTTYRRGLRRMSTTCIP